MSLSKDLAWRGLIKDKTFEEAAWLDEPKTFYLGIDASSDSLTIGNLAVLLLARRLSDAGWKALLLVGGATSLVGDPGGKAEERQFQEAGKIAANVEKIRAEIEKLFSPAGYELVNNLDWLGGLKYLDFLRDEGKYFSMTELMQRDFVAARMSEQGSGISYAEFSYSLLQGYDFWWLFKNKAAVLQIGASDQWGNMLSGVALVRKKEAAEVHAMSMPLVVNKLTGIKFGKSEEGAIWLDPAKTTPTQFYQFWINTDDDEVENYLKIFTILPREKIQRIMEEHRAGTSARKAQKILAHEVTNLVHGGQQNDSASSVTKYLTGQASVEHASGEEIELIKQQLPSAKVSAGSPVVDALCHTQLAASKTEARRLLDSGAVYVNGTQTKKDSFEARDFNGGRLLLRRGKAFKDSALVELE